MSGLPPLCDRVVRWGLVGLVAFTPLAFGTVEAWSIAIMEWGIVTLILVFGMGWIVANDRSTPRKFRSTGLELPLAGFLLLCSLQTVPVPLPWLKSLSPGSARMYQSVDLQTWSAAAQEEGGPPRGLDPLLRLRAPDRRPVSIHPPDTWARVRLLASFVGLFFLVSWWADQRDKALSLLIGVTVVGFLVAMFGLIQFLTWNGKIYWVRRVPTTSSFGPFVNHNHFAGYVEMVIPVAISLTVYLLEARRRPSPRMRTGAASPGFASPALHGEAGRWGKSGLAMFAAVILAVALFFSLSRGGILSSLLTGLLLFVLLWRRIASRLLKWFVPLVLPALVAALIAWIGADIVTQQLGTYGTLGSETSFQLRAKIWKHIVRNMPDFLWVGAGLGTFEDSFAPYTPRGSSGRWDRAHNDYLQVFWETGAVGIALVLLGSYVFVRRYLWPALRSSDHPLDLFRVGVGISLISIALHSIVDFNLQIGANGFLFSLLAGVLVALHRTSWMTVSTSPIDPSDSARSW